MKVARDNPALKVPLLIPTARTFGHGAFVNFLCNQDAAFLFNCIAHRGTTTKRQVSKRQVSKRQVS
jgi:hypothetical protein